MEKRVARVSETQWNILLDFLERNPNLNKSRGYNNSARGRAESSRKWSELAELLNAEKSGTVKTPKDWSIYVSNFKSKLRRTFADINADSSATGGELPSGSQFSNTELRFLSLMGPGFCQNVPGVAVHPLLYTNHQSTAGMEDQTPNKGVEHIKQEVFEASDELNNIDGSFIKDEPHAEVTAAPTSAQSHTLAQSPTPASTRSVPLRRRTRQARYRSRPLNSLDEAQRVSQAKLQQAAATMATAQANNLIAQNLGRLADAVERYLSHIGVP